MLLIIIGVDGFGSVAPCAAPLFLLHMEHSHSSCSSVVFLGGTAGCAFVSSLTRRLLCWAQLSGLSAFDFLFDSNGHLSVCPFESNGRLSSCRSSAFAVCSLDSKGNVLWPQSACSVSSFLTAAVFRS